MRANTPVLLAALGPAILAMSTVSAQNAPPAITCQPANQTALEGSTATFSVCATGSEPLAFQWRSYANSTTFTNIPWGTTATLSLTNVPKTSRRFGVVVTNPFGAVTSALATLTVTSLPPSLVSASSLNGTEIGVCVSRPMNATELVVAGNYRVTGSAGVVPVSSVVQWSGGTTAVLRVSAPLSGAFTVAAQGMRDLDGSLISASTVTGHVWGASLALSTIGTPGLPPQLFTCVDGRFTMRGEGAIYSGADSFFDYFYETRTNDFDIQVRVNSLTKATPPSATGLDTPYLACAGLFAFDPSSPKGPGLTYFSLPNAGSRIFMLQGWVASLNDPHIFSHMTWGGSAPSYPIWLRIHRSGLTFRCYYSSDGIEWVLGGDPMTIDAQAVMQVGLLSVSESSQVYATSEFENFGDTRLNPGAVVQITQAPADASIEENHSATLIGAATVSGAADEDLSYQWQAETAPNSGQFTNICVPSSARYITPHLSLADSGRRFRLLAKISGHPAVVSSAARVAVVADRTPPTVISATPLERRPEIVVTFSEPMDLTDALDTFNFNGNDFTVTRVSADETGTKFTLTLAAVLDPTSNHSLTMVDSTLRDRAGNLLATSSLNVAVTLPPMLRGGARQELFFGIGSVSSMRFGSGSIVSPDAASIIGELEGPTNLRDNYGTRISGYLIPPVTGNYNFWISVQDTGEFWLSTDEDPANLVMICSEPQWNGPRQYNTLTRRNPAAPENRSSSSFPEGIPLVAGRACYFEVLSVTEFGGDNLAVAWQVPGGLPPLDGGAPISGASLGLREDPTDAIILIRRHPQSTTALTVFSENTPGQPFYDESFDTSNGGFTTAQSGSPAGAWTHNAAGGFWSASGNPDFPISEKLLASPVVTVTRDGDVRLRFMHRYTFEEDYWDGGQIRVSVNGGAFTMVGREAFSSNGYTGIIDLYDTLGFGNTSPGYDNGTLLTSEARLGYFRAGDRIAVQFRGMWDYNTVAPGLGWVIDGVQLFQGLSGVSDVQFAIVAEAFDGDDTAPPLSYAWQRDCGDGFVDIPNANEAIYRFTPTAADRGCRYRCVVYTPGATATSEVATLEVTLPPIEIVRSGSDTLLTWSGQATLQLAPSPTGPWTSVDNATSPYRLNTDEPRRFYRLAHQP